MSDERNTGYLTIRLTEAMRDALRMIAEEEERTMSQVARILIREGLEARMPKEAAA